MTIIAALLLIILFPNAAFAYIGPGAGFVFISSFLVVFTSLILSMLSLILYPVRFVINQFRHRKKNILKTDTKKVVVVGFDGMDPDLTEQFIAEGVLPHFAKLKETCSYTELQTTNPPISPVAWSTFSTGSNPGKHNIFDFLAPNKGDYLSKLSSVEISPSTKYLNLGNFKIPLTKPRIISLKKSKTFWKILGEHGIYSIILRVPITYPAEKFFGSMISGMCVPDILGTQGTFSHYSSSKDKSETYTGGQQIEVAVTNNTIETSINGPNHPFSKEQKQLNVKMQIKIIDDKKIKISIGRKSYNIDLYKHSEWVEIPFKIFPGIKINGIAKIYLKSIKPDFEMYLSPINIDPENPTLPISSPKIFSIYLSKLFGKFSTLGLAEDTWALNEGIIDEKTFLEQSVEFYKERENVFFHSLKKIKKGAVVCVFDLTDRVQHMFMRYLDPGHPANKGKDKDSFKNAIKDTYILADKTVKRILDDIDPSTALIVLSDHGFKQFQQGFNLNKWLYENGYLSLKNSSQESGEWFENVDWKRTKAYGLGLSGLYINQKGREPQGIVGNSEDKWDLLYELKEKLSQVTYGNGKKSVIREAHLSSDVYHGPYADNAPDMLIGYYSGFRTSWNSVTGAVRGDVLEENEKRWSGDHVIDFREVPGILLSNRKIKADNPAIVDIAPSVLKLLGITPPTFMDGKPLF